MERQFATLTICNSSVHGTIPRSASFSDLPSTCRRIFYEELKTSEGLIKQYSCEQIFHNNSNIKQVEVSTHYKAGSKPERQEETWKSKLPALRSAAWYTPNLQDTLSTMKLEGSKSKSRSFRTLEINETKNSDNGVNEDSTTFFKKDSPPKIKIEPGTLDNNNDNKAETNKSKELLPIIMIEPATPGINNDNVQRNKCMRLSPRKRNIEPMPNVDSKMQDIPNINTMTDNSELKRTDSAQLKNKLRPLMPQEVTKTPQSNNRYLKLLFFALVTFAALIVSSLVNEFNQKPFDFTNTTVELKQKIFGQDKALNELNEYFHQNIEGFNAVVLVGGTGVGKTYTGEIIRNHFSYTYNIFEYYPPLHRLIEPAYNALSSLHCNLVLLENLKSDDVSGLVDFVKYFYQPKDRPCMIILAILNPQVTDEHLIKTMDLEKSVEDIHNVFEELEVPVKIVSFQSLTTDTIEHCIQEEARRHNIKLSEKEINEVTRQLIMSNSGCKRAYAKVQLYVKT